MPLKNRVTPFGEIIFSTSRGTLMGNRGVIHNENQQITRNFRLKAWITCRLEYKGFRRKVMSKNRWTELFFLDEATAFAAGHRPCAFCRNKDFKKFKELWLQANAEFYELEDVKISSLDEKIHAERIDGKGDKLTFSAKLSELPDRVLIFYPENSETCYLYYQNKLLRWTEFGYDQLTDADLNKEVLVLTPWSFVNVFKAGYKPEIHQSAKDLLKSEIKLL